jgi:hypothetical protein
VGGATSASTNRTPHFCSAARQTPKTATVSLHGNRYEVDAALVGRKVELVFDPFDLTRIEVRYQHRPFGLATPLQIGRYTHPQAKRELPPPPTGTGIDYLKLLAEQRDAELGGHRIDYASLANNDGDGDGDGDGCRRPPSASPVGIRSNARSPNVTKPRPVAVATLYGNIQFNDPARPGFGPPDVRDTAATRSGVPAHASSCQHRP